MKQADTHPSEPGILEFIRRCQEIAPDEAWEGSSEHQRDVYDRLCAAMRHPRPNGIAVSDLMFELPDRTVAVRRYAPPGRPPYPAVVYFHGGGWVVGGLDSHDDICAELAANSAVAVFAVDYRLCPEYPYPAALDDGFEVLARLRAEAEVHDIDAGRILLAGDSAGGNLAAALALRLRDGAGPQVCGMALIYPGLGGDRSAGSYVEQANAPFLTTASIDHYLALYSGGKPVLSDPYCMPLAASNFAGLPPAFVTAAHFDPLRDDAVDFAARLKAAEVPVELRVEPQMVHGWLRARHDSEGAHTAFAALCAAVHRLAG